MREEVKKAKRMVLTSIGASIAKMKKEVKRDFEEGRRKHDCGYNEAINAVVKKIFRKARRYKTL